MLSMQIQSGRRNQRFRCVIFDDWEGIVERPYLILVNGVLAARRLTFKGARKAVEELKAKGYTQVSLAYEK